MLLQTDFLQRSSCEYITETRYYRVLITPIVFYNVKIIQAFKFRFLCISTVHIILTVYEHPKLVVPSITKKYKPLLRGGVT